MNHPDLKAFTRPPDSRSQYPLVAVPHRVNDLGHYQVLRHIDVLISPLSDSGFDLPTSRIWNDRSILDEATLSPVGLIDFTICVL